MRTRERLAAEKREAKAKAKEKASSVPIEKKEDKVSTPPQEAVKKEKAKNEKIVFMTDLIREGKFNKAEIVEKTCAKFPEAAKSTIQTYLSDGKNPRYAKFEKLLTENKEGIVSFKK